MKKTIKLIDLLNKIAKGEEIPEHIRVGIHHFYKTKKATVREDYDYQTEDGEYLINYLSEYEYITKYLNDEVEIIEDEVADNFSGIRYFANGNCYMSIASDSPKTKDITIEKNIEKLKIEDGFNRKERTMYIEDKPNELSVVHVEICKKINELIDEINKLKESKNEKH